MSEVPKCKRCKKADCGVKEDGSYYYMCDPCRKKQNEALRKNRAKKKAEQEKRRQAGLKRIETWRAKKLAEKGAMETMDVETFSGTISADNESEVEEMRPPKKGKPITEDAPVGDNLQGKRSKPWKPASLLDVKDKDPNYTYKWCKTELMDKRVAEGWEPVHGKGNTNAPALTLLDGTQFTNLIRKRGLVLCRMPKDVAKSRSEYYQRLTDEKLLQGVEQYKSEANIRGYRGGSYGEIKIDAGQRKR